MSADDLYRLSGSSAAVAYDVCFYATQYTGVMERAVPICAEVRA
jgi:hypothetical protein